MLLSPSSSRDTAKQAVAPKLHPAKFRDAATTANGEARAEVVLKDLRVLWFNTGSLCNIACKNCYLESSPRNDRLVYLSAAEVKAFLDEIAQDELPLEQIGFTGGEPFLNPDFPAMLEDALQRGHEVLVLTNAMRPMMRPTPRKALEQLAARFGQRLIIRVSLDHYTAMRHDAERGKGSFAASLEGLNWLKTLDVNLHIAARELWEEAPALRQGFADLFAKHRLPIRADDESELVIFPEMDASRDVPEITTSCWKKLGVSPDSVMCASSRMIVKRKTASAPVVLPCTLLPYDQQFELGATLGSAAKSVKLNHPHCARFCVLGGASCSSA